MNPYTLNSENTRFLMIDMQEKLLPAIRNREQIQKNALRLSIAAQALRIPLIVTEQYPKGLGPTISELRPYMTEQAFEKSGFGCFDEDGFEEFFRSESRKQVVLFGIESHICVHATAMQLLERGYEVTVTIDACGSRDEGNHRIAVSDMSASGAHVLPLESVVYQLLRRSGTPEFKKLLPLFKE